MEDYRFIREFPHTYALTGGDWVDFGAIGNLGFRIQDTLLLITSSDNKSFRTICSLPMQRKIGAFLSVGSGPEEFVYRRYVLASTFDTLLHHVNELLYDDLRGQLYRFDITETLATHHLNIELVQDSLPQGCTEFFPIGRDFYYCRCTEDRPTSSYRFFLCEGKKYTTSDLEIANMPRIQDVYNLRQHISLLSSPSAISTNRDWIIESPYYFGLINLYPTDSIRRGKTLILADKMYTFEELESVPLSDRMRYIQNIVSYPRFFAVLWVNETTSDYRRIEGKNYSILFFDWNGNPLAQLQLDRRVISFDIDFRTSELYVLDKSDEFYKYDISHILSALHLP